MKLNDAVEIALRRNTQLQKSLESINSYESNAKAAFGALLPTLNASAGWNWTRSEDEGGEVNIGGSVLTVPKQVSESRNYSAGLSSGWNLFDGLSNYANLSRNRNNLEAAKFSLERIKQDIIYQTVSFYFDVLNAEKLLKVKEEDLKWNQKNYEIIYERNKLGAVTKADVYAQQVKLGNAELELIKAKNSLETIKSGMLYYLGLDVLEVYSFEDPQYKNNDIDPSSDDFQIDSNISELINSALKNRADYKSSQFFLESAYQSINMAKAGHLPTLRNYASFGLRSNQLKNLADSKTYQFGLSLDIPIFSGWSVDNRIQLAEVEAKTRQLDLADLERSIKRDLQKNYLDLTASEKRVDVSKKNVTAAEENRKIEEEKYFLGSTTLLNVLIANSEYTNALSGYINAQYEYLKLKTQAEYLLGTLK
jgi:outer membrane protein